MSLRNLSNVFILALSVLVGCGGKSNQSTTPPIATPTVTGVSVRPSSASLEIGTTLQFTADVTGTGNFDNTVRWSVAGVAGGNETLGTISATGLYTPPVNVPAPNTLSVQAVSTGDISKAGLANLTITEKPFRPQSRFIMPTSAVPMTIDGLTVQAAPGQVLIYLSPDITTAELDNLKSQITSSRGAIVGSLTATRTLQVLLPSDVSIQNFISAMRTIGGVRDAGPNLAVDLNRDNVSAYRDYLSRNPQPHSSQFVPSVAALPDELNKDWFYWVGHTNAAAAWDLTSKMASDTSTKETWNANLAKTKIGIIDTGINLDQDVIDSSRLERFDSEGNDLSGKEDDTKNSPEGFHGRWVTGFAAGYKDRSDGKVRGMAEQNPVVVVDVGKVKTDCSVEMAGVKLLCNQSMFITDLQSGTETAINHGAKIVNLSIGPTIGLEGCKDDPNTTQDETRHDVRTSILMNWRYDNTPLVEFAQQKDALLVFSAGNNCEKQDDQLFPSGKTEMPAEPWQTNAMLVAATDKSKSGADFSDFGNTVDLAAPGKDIGFYGGTGYVAALEGLLGMYSGSGTSFAAPLVTGTAAMLHDVRGDLSAPETRYILLESAQKLPITLSPSLLLDSAKAVSDASGISVDMVTADAITLSKGESKSIQIPVTLPASTVKSMDVVFLVDTTGSYADDIASLQAGSTNLIDSLTRLGVDVQFGVASFADFPFSPYGVSSAGDKAFFLNQAITNDVTAVKAGIDSLNKPLHNGNDLSESQLEALYQTATGAGLDLDGDGKYTALGELLPATIGWRPGSLKVVVFSTDAPFHSTTDTPAYPCPGCPAVTFDRAIKALNAKGITVMAIGSGNAETDMKKITTATGGVYYPLSGDFSSLIAQTIKDKLSKVNLSIMAISNENWIDSIAPQSFVGIQPGESRTFSVNLKGLKRSGALAQSYDVYLWVQADNSGVVKRVRIPISVPAQP